MEINFNEVELKAIDEMARKKDMSPTGIVRQAVRLYQLFDRRVEEGQISHDILRDKDWSPIGLPAVE